MLTGKDTNNLTSTRDTYLCVGLQKTAKQLHLSAFLYLIKTQGISCETVLTRLGRVQLQNLCDWPKRLAQRTSARRVSFLAFASES